MWTPASIRRHGRCRSGGGLLARPLILGSNLEVSTCWKSSSDRDEALVVSSLVDVPPEVGEIDRAPPQLRQWCQQLVSQPEMLSGDTGAHLRASQLSCQVQG